jgi:hypothetical protein
VPYPPPPARVEFVPDQPSRDAVWVDGEWEWNGRRWGWIYGGWVQPPKNATYSPWRTTRRADGTLVFSPGAWRDANGREVPAPRVLVRGRAREEPVVSPEGTPERTGPNLFEKEREPDGGGRTPEEAPPEP